MSHAIEFIETPMFTRQIKQIATDDELKELQKALIESPEKEISSGKPAGCENQNGDRHTGEKRQCAGDLLSGHRGNYLSGDGLPEKHQRQPDGRRKTDLKKLTKLLKDEV